MPETTYSTIPLSEPSARPGAELGWSRAGVADRGIKRLGDAVNSLLGYYQGMLVHDVFNPGELALTPSDPLHTLSVHRRWQVKTASRLEMTATAQRTYRLDARVAKATGAGLQYQLYVGGSLVGTYSFASGGLSEQWMTLFTFQMPDNVDYQEVRLQLSGWHGGAASTDYCRAVRIYPVGWTSIADQAGGWRFLQTPVPVSAFGVDHAAASWLIQAMQTNLRWLYSRRVSTLYGSTGFVDLSGAPTTEISKMRADPPPGVLYVRFWCYGKGLDANSSWTINGYTTEEGATENKFGAGVTSWRTILYSVAPRGTPPLRLSVRNAAIYSLCAYFEDANPPG